MSLVRQWSKAKTDWMSCCLSDGSTEDCSAEVSGRPSQTGNSAIAVNSLVCAFTNRGCFNNFCT